MYSCFVKSFIKNCIFGHETPPESIVFQKTHLIPCMSELSLSLPQRGNGASGLLVNIYYDVV